MKKTWYVLGPLFIFSASLVIFAEGDKDNVHPVAISAPTVPKQQPLSEENRTALPQVEFAKEVIENKQKPMPALDYAKTIDTANDGNLVAASSQVSTKTLFSAHSWAPPISAPATQEVLAPQIPSLPFVFIGKQFDGAKWQVFLMKGNDTLVVREGESIGSEYRVEKIKLPTLTFRYLPLDMEQQLFIGNVEQ